MDRLYSSVYNDMSINKTYIGFHVYRCYPLTTTLTYSFTHSQYGCNVQARVSGNLVSAADSVRGYVLRANAENIEVCKDEYNV